MSSKIVIDPVTRIEGHLRMETAVDGGLVSNAWSTGTLFRGVEMILKNRDPRDAWMLTQRICGVCTYVHGSASVKSVEDAVKNDNPLFAIPDNARLVRNILMGAQFVQDHIIHFYHLHALDWVDVLSALSANTTVAATTDAVISSSRGRNTAYFDAVKAKLQASFVTTGQLGPFANGYWGHSAYKLSPEVNLIMVADYLEALSIQSDIIKIHALLGGKNPHPQSLLIGGITQDWTTSAGKALGLSVLNQALTLCAKAQNFVNNYYVPDVIAAANVYKNYGYADTGGFDNLLCVGEFPQWNDAPYFPGGAIFNRSTSSVEAVDVARITEDVAKSWYIGTDDLNPSVGVTDPAYTGIDLDDKYSWLKAPRYRRNTTDAHGLPMEVGPLARVMVGYLSNCLPIKSVADIVLGATGLSASQMYSTLGRIAARAIETKVIADAVPNWITELQGRLNANQTTNRTTFAMPASGSGLGFNEAPRGILGHWLNFENTKISNYQMVVPSTWNFGPRDALGVAGPVEQALVGTPVADESKPLEILRVIHSFDPCIACAVHVVDLTEGGEESITVR